MDKVIQSLIKKAKKDPRILAVALFGSYARGEQYNDIDLCIFLVPKHYSSLELSRIKMEYVPENEKYDLHLFQELPLYIKQRVLNEAKFIYRKNEDLLYDLYFETSRQYLFFQPIYENYLKGVAHG